MSANTEQMREAFEKWMRSVPGHQSLAGEYMNENSGRYDSAYTNLMWQAWQAALSSLPPVAREDYEKLFADLARAKNLLVRLHAKHPDARAQIEGSTGTWFIWGMDRDAPPPSQVVVQPTAGEIDHIECEECGAFYCCHRCGSQSPEIVFAAQHTEEPKP